MSIKNPTLRRRTKELTECANDARECQLLGYELKELGNLVASMAIHMGDLQRKIDSQAEHIKALNEKLTNSEIPNNCEPQFDKDINVRSKDEPYIDIETGILHWCGWKYRRIYEDEPQKIGYCNECKWFRDKQVCGRCRSKNLYAPMTEPQIVEQAKADIEKRSSWSKTYEAMCKDEPQTDCPWK